MARRTRSQGPRTPINPEPPSLIKVAADRSRRQGAKLDPVIISTHGEGQKLWNHVLFGTGTCVGMLEGYRSLSVPGDPLPGLLELKERIDNLVSQYENSSTPSGSSGDDGPGVVDGSPGESQLRERDSSDD